MVTPFFALLTYQLSQANADVAIESIEKLALLHDSGIAFIAQIKRLFYLSSVPSALFKYKTLRSAHIINLAQY